jgi:hypothetical protein
MPLGWERYSSVLTANQMVARCCILMILAAARGIWVVCEQPKGSLMQFHPCFEAVMDLVPLWRKFIRMGDFGASSEKGTWLYSSRDAQVCFMQVQTYITGCEFTNAYINEIAIMKVSTSFIHIQI